MEQLIYDRTQLDVDLDTEKGSYNFTDLKRIENWCQYLSKILNSYNYNNIINVKTDWAMVEVMTTENSPTEAQMERTRQNLIILRNAFYTLSTTPATPENLDFMTFQKANDIEKILFDIDRVIEYMESDFIYCGVANCGQNRIWQKRFRHRKYEKYILKNLLKPIEEEEFMIDGGSVACEKSTTHVKYGSNSLLITGDAGDSEKYGISTTNYPLEPTHLYYARVEVYSETGVGTYDFFWKPASPSFFGGKNVYANTWIRWSVVANRSNFTAGKYPYRLDYNNGGVADKAWFDGAMIIDLTEAFGSGNEPTQDWCDNNIPYFAGEKIIRKIKEDEK